MNDQQTPLRYQRRDFLKLTTGFAAGGALGGAPMMAAPFSTVNDYLRLIPADKKLDPVWVRSLFQRGEKETYSQPAALRHIGMPVGGLFAGTVYLGGDGRLWLWDVFNRDQEGIRPRQVSFRGGKVRSRDGANYVEPAAPESPFRQGFVVRANGVEASLDLEGFKDITFRGEYPRATVSYGGGKLPVSARLEAFSPFIPMNANDSSLPATVMSYTVRNEGAEPLDVGVLGRLQNAICLETGKTGPLGQRRNRVVRADGLLAVECSARPQQGNAEDAPRADLRFEDFEKETYEGWSVTGTAFGTGPVRIADIPGYQGDVGGSGERVVNSHASAPGEGVGEKDGHTGRMISRPFTVNRRFIVMRIGGGSHGKRTGVSLVVGGRVVATVTGGNANRMSPAALNVGAYEGQEARLHIEDAESGAWGNVGVDDIVFTDTPPGGARDLEAQRDFGTMTLALLGSGDGMRARASRGQGGAEVAGDLGADLEGEVGGSVRLAPGEEAVFTFVIAWHFPNFRGRGVGNDLVGHHYASRFGTSTEVAGYVAGNFDRLAGETRRWVETWYDSTLPYWFLDRTMANTSILATTTCYRFRDGRFWAWEGVGCCPGTCTHVWHYAQAPGRLFPEVERDTRERVDFGIGFHQDGAIGHRTGLNGTNHAADDGHCGRILGAYREHQMTGDDAFLKRIWPRVKKAVEFMIGRDGNDDGILDDAQANTLDASWYGKVSFLASLYLAALRAGEAMALEMGDDAFAERCRTIAARGAESILELHNGEYFIQIEDPKHSDQIGVGPGCYIDQMFGQTWAHWVGLGRLFDREKQVGALRALYRYNFVPDVGPFRDHFKLGRWYATAGDAGLLMCTWPKGGQNPKFIGHWQYMYFNECMSGFEWQAAAHMIWEGLLEEGLAVSRAIHDRYNAARRNPYNEIECSDHYSRAMASYGAFQAACGFEHHGPKGHIGFAPRLSPEDFKCAFTAAGAWGSFSQKAGGGGLEATLAVKWGRLRLRSLALEVPANSTPRTVTMTVGRAAVPGTVGLRDTRRVMVTLAEELELAAGEELRVTLR